MANKYYQKHKERFQKEARETYPKSFWGRIRQKA